MSNRLIFFHIFFFVLLSCVPNPNPNPQQPPPFEGGEQEPPPRIIRDNPKIPDPVKQEVCRSGGRNTCEDNKKCQDVCDDVFNRRADKKDCYELPESLVLQFEDLLEFVEDGDIEDIEPTILECMLDIDETEFAKSVKKMSRSEAKRFLASIADNSELAEILEEEDDEFVILKQILNKATGSNALSNQLEKEIEDDKGFLWLAGEHNESAWDWLDGYVNDVCDRSASECPGRDNIGAYCKILIDFNNRDLEDFLSDTDLFAEEYEDDVEDENYLYEVDSSPGDRYEGDFRDYCNEQILATASCPADGTEPPRGERLAEITFQEVNSFRHYWISGGYCHPGQSQTDRSEGRGSADPSSQNIILNLNDYEYNSNGVIGELLVDKDEIDYDTDKTYYLYIGENRYELDSTPDHDYTESCASRSRDVVGWADILEAQLSNTGPYNVYLASQEEGEDCEYYKP